MRSASSHGLPGSGSPTDNRVSRRVGSRVALLVTATALAALNLSAKAWAERHLTDTIVNLGPLQLRLAHNPGVAFSLGDRLPSSAVITGTAAITAMIATYAWRTAPTTGRLARWSWAAILGGAAANLIDRLADGVVTDYLHTGWWPTFNLADTLLSLGVVGLVVASLGHDSGPAGDPGNAVEEDADR